MILSQLDDVLFCPRCSRGGLRAGSQMFVCGACSAGFPVIDGIPWLFCEPQHAAADWRNRLNLLNEELMHESRCHRDALREPNLSAAGHARLTQLADAYEDQAARLRALLAPLDIVGHPSRETLLALRTRLPLEQGLTNYYVNVHRDYAWGDRENAATARLLNSVIPESLANKRILVLGAGAGRLAYDLHREHAPALTVACDFNPLLLIVARTVFAGGSVALYEFPIAPRETLDHAVLRTLAVSERPDERLVVVGADALHPPFSPATFDAVVTPWFIDIVPEPFPRLAARINGLLARGGRWLNVGSLAFVQDDRSLRFGKEEVLETVVAAGFEAPRCAEEAIPYMSSPASRHARVEMLLAWSAAKRTDVAQPGGHSTLPPWLLDPDEAVPLLDAFRTQAATTRIQGALMGLIDGQRSVRAITAILVENRLMGAADADAAVRRFLGKMHEDAIRRTRF